MKKSFDDCWAPLPGSWEELVEPYDCQRARFDVEQPKEEQQKLPLEVIADPQKRPGIGMPVSV